MKDKINKNNELNNSAGNSEIKHKSVLGLSNKNNIIKNSINSSNKVNNIQKNNSISAKTNGLSSTGFKTNNSINKNSGLQTNLKEKKLISDEDKLKSDFTVRYAMEFYLKEKNVEVTLKILEKAIFINPDNQYAYYNRAVIYYGINDFSNAITDLEKSIAISPDYQDAIFNLANIFTKTGNIDKAFDNYQKILKNNPNTIDALFNIGLLYLKYFNDYTKSIECFDKIVKIDSFHKDAYFNLALSYYLNKNKEKSIEIYNELIMLFSNYSMAYYNLGTIYYELNRKDRAIVLFKKYIDMPKHVSEYNYLKIARRRIKEYEE